MQVEKSVVSTLIYYPSISALMTLFFTEIQDVSGCSMYGI